MAWCWYGDAGEETASERKETQAFWQRGQGEKNIQRELNYWEGWGRPQRSRSLENRQWVPVLENETQSCLRRPRGSTVIYREGYPHRHHFWSQWLGGDAPIENPPMHVAWPGIHPLSAIILSPLVPWLDISARRAAFTLLQQSSSALNHQVALLYLQRWSSRWERLKETYQYVLLQDT